MHSPPQPHASATFASAPAAAAETGHAAHAHRTVAEHRRAVRELLEPLPAAGRTERLSLADALGNGLAETVTAPVSLPSFANSQMDGFAISAADVPDGGAELRVVDSGSGRLASRRAEPGEAAPIMTGAMVPAGADAVVPVERAVPDRFPVPGEVATVWLPAAPAGTYIRRAGSDIRAGEIALAAGTFLGPGQLGLLAALGCRTSWSTLH